MKLEYFDLISPEPIFIKGVGNIKSPTLREIAQLTNSIYELYITFINMTPDRYCTEVNEKYKKWYDNLSEEDLMNLNMYDIAVSSSELSQTYSSIFDFFFIENVRYSKEQDCFLVFMLNENVANADKGFSIIGEINKDNFTEICNIILQLNHIDNRKSDISKAKNKKGLARYMEMQKRKQKNGIKQKSNPDLDFGNIISSICGKGNGINYINVWDMTVYQLWDIFSRTQEINVYELSKTSVSIWGDKEKQFNLNGWFKNIVNR